MATEKATSGRFLVFKKNIIAPLHGTFNPGDMGENVDAAWAEELVKADAAEFAGSQADAKKLADQFATAAGRRVNNGPKPTVYTPHTFSASDDSVRGDSVGAEGTQQRVAASQEPQNSAAQSSAQPHAAAAKSAPAKSGGRGK